MFVLSFCATCINVAQNETKLGRQMYKLDDAMFMREKVIAKAKATDVRLNAELMAITVR